MSVIRFFDMNAEYGEFSNLASFPVEIDGELWPTVEHYYQAEKFTDKDYRESIRATEPVREAIQMGRSREFAMRADWKTVKIEVMKRALTAKYTQHPDLKKLLLSTDSAILVEHTPKDSYWGDGGDGTGQNNLGKLLMELRHRLKQL